jgi:hypothetical protein
MTAWPSVFPSKQACLSLEVLAFLVVLDSQS